MAFKFIHIADVHLDTPFKNRDKNMRMQLKECQRAAFKSAVSTAVDQNADAVLIAGDLFDNDTLSFKTEKMLINEMDKLDNAGIKVFYAPGNHDPYGNSSRIKNIKFPECVHVFGSDHPEVCEVSSRDKSTTVKIVGMGHKSSFENRNLASLFPKAEGGIPYIGLLHSFVTGVFKESCHEKYAPCTLKELIDKGYTYWALGHIHAKDELCSFPLVVYSGNIIGRNHGEEGQKGAYVVSVDGNGNVDASFKVLTDVLWQTLTVKSIKDAASINELEKIIVSEVSEYQNKIEAGSRIYLRLVLQGPCRLYSELKSDEDIEYLSSSLKSALDVEDIELVTDGVVKPADIEKYRNQPHIMGSVLSLIDTLYHDDEMLLTLCPDQLGGFKGTGDQEKLAYLRELLDGMDYEALKRLIREDS